MLYACNACRRFVREDEPCPFCGDDSPRARPRYKQFGRIFVAATAASAITMHACSAYGVPAPPGGPYVNKDAAADGDAGADADERD